MWLFLFIMNLLIPLTMIGFGLVFMLNPPGEINGLYGYRTQRSQSSEAAWIFAHKYFGRLWLILGLLVLPLTVFAMVMIRTMTAPMLEFTALLICLVQLFVMLIPVVPTELALKKRFGE